MSNYQGGGGSAAPMVSESYFTDAAKQVPGPPPYNASGRTDVPGRCTYAKSPSYVLVTKTMTLPFGFWSGTSQSFHELGGADNANGGAGKSTSGEYDSDWGLVTVGTRLDIHPNAWSGSLTDADNLKFIYKSGKSTGGR
tara:strand:- start:470 stop:886 length:417 start_codon:yes stop_codon:yes gene_type:complete